MKRRKEQFCSICECKLGKKDLDHVCRSCYQKAREPKTVELQVDDRAAMVIGTAYAIGDLINWGVKKLCAHAGVKLPKHETKEEADKAALEARKKLQDIIDRLHKLDGDPGGGPDPGF